MSNTNETAVLLYEVAREENRSYSAIWTNKTAITTGSSRNAIEYTLPAFLCEWELRAGKFGEPDIIRPSLFIQRV